MKTFLTILLSLGVITQSGALKIVVISGEGGVNIIQQKTAVAPVVEIRDRNNLPVAGASVTFSLTGGSGASFAGASTLTVATNAAGQATAAGLTPTAAGAIHINVAAAFQGQSVTAAITQTNVLTAAQAASAASGAGGGGGGGSAAAAGSAGGAAGGGGIGLTTIAIVGGAVAGGAVVATQTGVIGGSDAFVTMKGVVYDTVRFGGVCTVQGGGSADLQPPRECYGNAVVGGVVSTTIDATTATTDGSGNFDLVTTKKESDFKCQPYTLTISAAGLPTYSIPVVGFATSNSSHRQQFAFTPPTPSSMNGACQ